MFFKKTPTRSKIIIEFVDIKRKDLPIHRPTKVKFMPRVGLIKLISKAYKGMFKRVQYFSISEVHSILQTKELTTVETPIVSGF